MSGDVDGFTDMYYKVRKPGRMYYGKLQKCRKRDTDFYGGYVIYSGASRATVSDNDLEPVLGAAFKEAIQRTR